MPDPDLRREGVHIRQDDRLSFDFKRGLHHLLATAYIPDKCRHESIRLGGRHTGDRPEIGAGMGCPGGHRQVECEERPPVLPGHPDQHRARRLSGLLSTSGKRSCPGRASPRASRHSGEVPPPSGSPPRPLTVAEGCVGRRGCMTCIVPPYTADEFDMRSGIPLVRRCFMQLRTTPSWRHPVGCGNADTNLYRKRKRKNQVAIGVG